MIKFCKFQGFGNDYLVFEMDELSHVQSLNKFARKVCDRHYGVGADGIATVKKLDGQTADFEVRIFNPDASEAGFSGNGTRCAVAYLHYQKIWTDENVRLLTKSGVKNYRLTETVAEGKYWFEAEIGRPKLASDEIPFISDERLEIVREHPFVFDNQEFLITAVNVGNPVCAIFVKDFESLDWRKIGQGIEKHSSFPERTNVVFIKEIDYKNIKVRIWERGAGETLASGTCTTAAAVASSLNGKTGRDVAVHAEGGTIEVNWRETDDVIVMKGRADFVFMGEFQTA
jgi:diaminopimelate epimerase